MSPLPVDNHLHPLAETHPLTDLWDDLIHQIKQFQRKIEWFQSIENLDMELLDSADMRISECQVGVVTPYMAQARLLARDAK